MNSLYPELAGIAAGMLKEFGQTATLTRKEQSSYNDETGGYETREAVYMGNAAAFGYDDREIDGHNIVQGDVKVYLERMAVEPKVGDMLHLGGGDWHVKNVRPVAPAGWAVVYVLQVGK